MIRIPPKVRQDAPIKAADYNALRDALVAMEKEMRGLRVRGGPGILARHSPSGIALRMARQPNLPKGTPPPFSILTRTSEVTGEGDEAVTTFEVTLQPGYLHEYVTKASGSGSDDGTKDHEFNIEVPGEGDTTTLVPMSTIPRPTLSVEAGATVYAKWETDDRGNVEGDSSGEEGGSDKRPRLTVSTDEQTSTHHQPPADGEDEGTDGEYYVPLFRIMEDAETKEITIEYLRLSDIDWHHVLWKEEHVGGGSKIIKGRKPENDTYEIRGLEGNYGIKDVQESDRILFDFLGENQGTGIPVMIDPADPEAPAAGPVKMRTLRGLSSSEASDEGITPQLRVEVKNEPGEELPDPQAKTVLFRGNGKKGSRVWLQCDETTEIARIEWVDGFVTSEGDVNIIVGDCPGSSTEPPPP